MLHCLSKLKPFSRKLVLSAQNHSWARRAISEHSEQFIQQYQSLGASERSSQLLLPQWVKSFLNHGSQRRPRQNISPEMLTQTLQHDWASSEGDDYFFPPKTIFIYFSNHFQIHFWAYKYPTICCMKITWKFPFQSPFSPLENTSFP